MTNSATLIPNLISEGSANGQSYFSIFDAKYYNMQLEKNKPLRGQPRLESVTKQYLYQLAFQQFIKEHGFDIVKNCFLIPTQSDDYIQRGRFQWICLVVSDWNPYKIV